MNATTTNATLPTNNSTASCGSSLCCIIEDYSVQSNGININIFNTGVVVLVFLSILIIMCRMQGSAVRTQLPVYYNFMLFTCATFFSVIVLQLLPQNGALVWDILSQLLIAPQWIVQCGVVFFLLARNADSAAGWRAFKQASAFAAVLMVIHVVPIAIQNTGCDLCGAIVSQILICAFFLGGLVLGLMPSRPARPALRWWAAYQLLAHCIFLTQYALYQWLPLSNVQSCFYIIALAGYYLFYAPVLLIVISSDTAYWRSHGALMLYYEQQQQEDGLREADEAAEDAAAEAIKEALLTSAVTASSSSNKSADSAAPDHQSASTYVSSTQTNVIDFAELELGGVLGVGQFGVVHEGKFRNKQVAVKLLRQLPSAAISEVMRDLLRESRLLLALRSEYVVGCVGVILDDEHLGLVTELMEISLWDALHNTTEPDRQSVWPLERTVSLMTDVARGLQYLHSRRPPIIHRDIKSHNILLKFNGRSIMPARCTIAAADDAASRSTSPPPPPPEVGAVHTTTATAASATAKTKRLLDWSWPPNDVRPTAKVCDLGVSRAKLGTTHMTRVGTAHWAAPELLLGQAYNERVDIYSFGVVWWECVTRKKPFASMSPMRVITAVTIEHLRLPVPADVPAPLASLIKRMWNTTPSKRPTATEVLKQLSEIFGER